MLQGNFLLTFQGPSLAFQLSFLSFQPLAATPEGHRSCVGHVSNLPSLCNLFGYSLTDKMALDAYV